MITAISNDDMHRIAPLFDGWDETLIWSCLQGHMGGAWADDGGEPSAAQIIVGDFCFLAGDASSVEAGMLTAHIPEGYARPYMLIIPKDSSWHNQIERTYQGQWEKQTRYAIKKEPDVFDRVVLQRYISALPSGYTLCPITEPLYHWSKTEKWARDFCSQFPDYADYQSCGLGYAVLYGDRPVCGASSYTVYGSGIEIEIATEKAHRRKGLAAACAAGLILACLDRGLYPSWDAANPASLALAEKLGYHFDKEYVCYEISGFSKLPPLSQSIAFWRTL